MAGTSNTLNQREEKMSITFMDPSLYKAAAKGEIGTFKQQAKHLDLRLLLTPNKNTILHINITSQYGRDKSFEFVKEILSMCPPLLLQVNTRYETPLHIAARHGDVAVVNLLIQTAKAADCHKDLESRTESVRQMLRMMNKEKDTALHEAVQNNHLDVIKLLIKEDPDFSYPANHAGETPLYLAAERGYRESVFEILRTCNSPAHVGLLGRTALHAAVICRDEEMTREILVRAAKLALTKEADQRGWVPLHYAALCGDVSIVRLLLELDKSAAYIADNTENKIAVHVAAGQGHLGVMKELLSRCPDCWELVDNRGRNALQFATESQCPEAVELILQDLPLNDIIKKKDSQGQGHAPLHLLVASLHHPKVDKQNQSALDIDKFRVLEKYRTLSKCPTMPQLEAVGAAEPNTNLISHNGSEEGRRSKDDTEDYASYYMKTKDSHLIVSILIATVTFAAGLTMPGGYVNDKGHDQGSATLTKVSAFKAFVVTDTLALAYSSMAVSIHVFLAMRDVKHTFLSDYNMMMHCTIYAVFAMMIAFVTGTYAVLEHSQGLAIFNTVIGCLFLWPLLYLFDIGSDQLPELR